MARLPKSFFIREDVVQVSKDLLGKKLVTNWDGQYCEALIVETEAYRGPDDKACHAYNNRRTSRTEIMFWEGGHAYVYLCYGIHHLFNVVTAKKEMPHAVLVRALQPLEGTALMLQRRKAKKLDARLTAGPGVLSQAMGIHRQHTGINLLDPDSPIWLEEGIPSLSDHQIIASPRVGVAYAEECARWNWRFRIKDNGWTSKAR